MAKHTVAQGECSLSLASDAGLFWQDVWQDSANDALRAKRKHPTVLMPGDSIEVRSISSGEEASGTEARHTFGKKGIPAFLRLRLRIRGEPVDTKEITFVVDGAAPVTVTTGSDGRVELPIPPAAAEVRMRVQDDRGEYLLKLAWLDPIDEASGLQARLYNLGFDPKGIDNDFGKGTREAMQAFQKSVGLKSTHKPNDETRDRLEAEYGC
jgi:hypothetical protein